MWSAAEYGGVSVGTDYGGGYMASTAGSATAKKPTNQGSIVPCTCAEIMAATQEGDKFVSPMGMEFSQVTVLGVVRSVNESATRIEYEVDDYTGPYLPVKMFVEDQDNASANQSRPFRELSYVRVHGHVRNFQGQKHIIAFRVLPVTDMNELTTHIMEVIFARMLYTKAKMDETNGVGPKGAPGMLGSSLPSSSVANGLTVVQNQILAIVRTFVGERGIPVSQLCEKLRGIPERQIR
ncbi:Replication protein A subunit [Fasciola gigantica]|uniref:Replication protein A subunit n=1 Tax=Fasciola gigantica TaxID=46835 RepID=A0A504Z0S6_FASGI|nr:Replication protein A subunit [Fasciola gigantica]